VKEIRDAAGLPCPVVIGPPFDSDELSRALLPVGKPFVMYLAASAWFLGGIHRNGHLLVG